MRDAPAQGTLPVQRTHERASDNHGGDLGAHGPVNRPAQKSLVDTIKSCIPEDSALMRSIKARKPNALLVNEKHPDGLRWNLSTLDSDLKNLHENPPRSGGSALIIQDIDQGWGQTLISRYPRQACPGFLAKHMIRLDSRSAVEEAVKIPTSTWRAVQQGRFVDTEELLLRGLTSSLSEDTNGFHVDCDFSSVIKSTPGWSTTHVVSRTVTETSFSVGIEALGVGVRWTGGRDHEETTEEIRLPKIWKRSRTRLSCCQLEEHLCEKPTRS